MLVSLRWLLLAMLITGAILSYGLGSIHGLGVFIAVALGFELFFWVVLRMTRPKAETHSVS